MTNITIPHDSDCAIHNGPGLQPGPCDCSLSMLKSVEKIPVRNTITIPHEAIEAAKRAYANCEDDANCIEAACLAMLKNWPGIASKQSNEHVALVHSNPAIILPLTQEPSDGK
jgi:hypothetical protein